MEPSQEKVGSGSILCLLYQSIHIKQALRSLPQLQVASQHRGRAAGSTWSSSVLLPAEWSPRVPSAGGQSCVIAEGCKRATDQRAQLRDTVQVPAGWCIVTFRAPKVCRREHSVKLDPCHQEAHCKQVLVFWGRHVETFRFNCKWLIRMPTRWQQAGPLQAHELQSPAQAKKKKIKKSTLWAWEGDILFYKDIRMLLNCKCDLHIFNVFETSCSSTGFTPWVWCGFHLHHIYSTFLLSSTTLEFGEAKLHMSFQISAI